MMLQKNNEDSHKVHKHDITINTVLFHKDQCVCYEYFWFLLQLIIFL